VTWFHCASLGEFEQGRPIIEASRERFPESRILLTFFSPSGYEKRKHFEGADHVMYLPLDTRRNAGRMLGALGLERAFFIKYEFWYHFLDKLKQDMFPPTWPRGISARARCFSKGMETGTENF
jgi:3-deoxy-D-manno-octulosonic-acid transferase